MKKYLFVSTMALFGLAMVACNEEAEQMEMESTELLGKEATQDVPDVYPVFPGGEEELYAYLADNISYPEQAKKIGVEGRVYVQFEVSTTGEVKDVVAVRGIGAGADEEALRVVGAMPNWEPASKDGNPVATKMVIPITFALD